MQSVRVPLALLGLLLVGVLPPPAAGMLQAAPRSPGERSLPELPRITAELRDLPIEAAAARLASLLGVNFHVPPRPPAGSTAAPVLPLNSALPSAGGSGGSTLDYDRKRSFSWSEVPVADALREFCRQYGCSLGIDYRGNFTVLPVPLASGPAVMVDGYRIWVEALHFSDSRFVDEAGEFTARRHLLLHFTVRAETAHVARIYALENVRVEDQAGRDVLDKAGRDQPLTPAAPRAFPDERSQNIRLEWPYPSPERLKRVEGDLVLYRRVSLQQVEFDVPAPGQTSEIKENGDVQCQLVQVDASAEGFRTTLRVMCPASTGVQLTGVPSAAEFVLPDGKRVSAAVTGMGWGMSEGWKSLDFYLHVNRRSDLRGKLKLRFIRQEDPGRRLHFRMTDFPYPLTPPAEARGARPVPRGVNAARSILAKGEE